MEMLFERPELLTGPMVMMVPLWPRWPTDSPYEIFEGTTADQHRATEPTQ